MNEALHLRGGTQERRARPAAAIRCMSGTARRPSANAAHDLAGLVIALPSHHSSAGILAGEAWLTLPTWQLAATSSVSIDDRTGLPADDGDDDGGCGGDGNDGNGNRNFVERDDLVAAAQWNGDVGQFTLPRTTPPSCQAPPRTLAQNALTNLALEQSIRSP